MKKRVTAFGVVALMVFLFVSAARAEEQKVVEYLIDEIGLYEEKGNSFVLAGKSAAGYMPALPVLVLESSPMGYVKIRMDDKDVWLDTMDVDVEPPKTAGDCEKKSGVSSSSKKKAFHTRGIGE